MPEHSSQQGCETGLFVNIFQIVRQGDRLCCFRLLIVSVQCRTGQAVLEQYLNSCTLALVVVDELAGCSGFTVQTSAKSRGGCEQVATQQALRGQRRHERAFATRQLVKTAYLKLFNPAGLGCKVQQVGLSCLSHMHRGIYPEPMLSRAALGRRQIQARVPNFQITL